MYFKIKKIYYKVDSMKIEKFFLKIIWFFNIFKSENFVNVF